MSERVASRSVFMCSMADVYDVTLCLACCSLSPTSTRFFSWTHTSVKLQATTRYNMLFIQFNRCRYSSTKTRVRSDESSETRHSQSCVSASLTNISSSCRSCPSSMLNWWTAVCSRCFSDTSWSRRWDSHSNWRWCSNSRRAASQQAAARHDYGPVFPQQINLPLI